MTHLVDQRLLLQLSKSVLFLFQNSDYMLINLFVCYTIKPKYFKFFIETIQISLTTIIKFSI